MTRKRVLWIAALLLAAGTSFLQAADYTVDPAQPEAATNYHSVDALRQAVATWADGDTITLVDVADDSITAGVPLVFDANNITIAVSGSGTVSPNDTGSTVKTNQFLRVAGTTDWTQTLALAAEDGKSLVFDGFNSSKLPTGTSGVIFAGDPSDPNIKPDVTVKLGTAGGIGELVFSNNIGEFGTAVNSNGTVEILGGTNTFRDNASDAAAGAIGAYTLTIFDGINTFENNKAGIGGGALYCSHEIEILGGVNLFKNNSLTIPFFDGGAIWCKNIRITGGDTTFDGNTGGSAKGGAAYVAQSAAIIADGGDVVFRGNTISDGTANAVYMGNEAGGGWSLTLAAKGDNSVLFHDPVTSNAATADLAVVINSVDGTDAGKTDGTIVFDGAYWLDPAQGKTPAADANFFTSKIYGTATVYGGTLALFNGVTFENVAAGGAFDLNAGATLAVNGGQYTNTVKAETISLDRDSVLFFDLADADDIGAIACLTLAGTNYSVLGADDTLNFAVHLGNAKSGTFTLVATDLAGNFAGFDAADALSRLRSVGSRVTAAFSSADSDSDLVLNLTLSDNAVLYWTGETDGVWDFDTKNWTDRKEPPIKTFANGDTVIFDWTSDPRHRDVTLDDVMRPADMIVAGGNYTFGGQAIQSTDQTTLADTSQKLTVAGFGTTATFVNGLDFSGGIDVVNGGTLVLTESPQSQNVHAVTTDTLTVAAGSTLKISATEGKLTVGKLTLDDDRSPDNRANIEIVNAPPMAPGTSLLRVDDVIVASETLDAATLSEKLDKTVGLRTQTVEFDPDDLRMSVLYSTDTLGHYLGERDVRDNLKRLGNLLEEVAPGSPFADYYNRFGDLDDAEIIATLDRLGAGETAVDGMAMSLWSPWRRTHRRLAMESDCLTSLERWSYRHEKCRTDHEIWFEGQFVADSVSASVDALKYHHQRNGVILGIEKRLGRDVRAGAMFSYGRPRTYNRIAKAEADDYTVGIYGRTPGWRGLHANVFLGYGHQEYDYENRGTGFKTGYDGDSMYASVEFVRPLVHRFGDLALLPLVAVDHQQTWMNGFVDGSPNQPALRYAGDDMAQTLIRFGLNSRFVWKNRVNLATRLQYAINVNDRYGEMNTSFVDTPGEMTVIRGANLGRNLLNIGLGGEIVLGDKELTRLYVDYDFLVSDHATNHTGYVGVERKW